jgi:hypothetical protein
MLFTFTTIYFWGAVLAFALYAYKLYKIVRPMPFKSFSSFVNALKIQGIQPIWPQFLASLDEPSRKQVADFLWWGKIASIAGLLLIVASVFSNKILTYLDSFLGGVFNRL